MRSALAFMLVAAVAFPDVAAAKHLPVIQPMGQSASYACTDGRTIELLFAGDGSAVLTLSRGTHTLMARDGVHFVGEGLAWTSTSPTVGQLTAGGAGQVSCRVR